MLTTFGLYILRKNNEQKKTKANRSVFLKDAIINHSEIDYVEVRSVA